MIKQTQNIKSFKIIYPQVYSYILPNRNENKGSQKIGYTEKKNVDIRILQQVKTAAAKLKYETLWSAPAFFEGGKESFRDYPFHKFLEKKGIERKINLGKEWFYFNGEPFKSKDLFDLFRKERFAALQNDEGKVEYTLRFEQEEAVSKAKKYFEENEKGEFLWNAKPRFGKTLASYDLAKRLEANKVLIVTNRPAIANSWFDDYEKFIYGYAFISETSSLNSRSTITREQHIKIQASKPHFTFLSLQDLKGSKYFGGPYDKLRWIADLEWDLLIVDEAHEGIDTGRTDAAFDIIRRKHTLHLSGTPFKALANEKFPRKAIFNWTYLDEQKIKQIEIEEDESGEHTDMPDLKLFTYRISQMITNQVNEGLEIDNENFDYAFDLNEFFRAKNKKFVRENEVKDFLKNLTTNKKYPFSTPEHRNELKHTFWYVGNRVDSVKALEQLLKKDPVFKDYKIIVAAGDGRTFEEEENDFRSNEKSYKKVKKAILENDKTITLSCGQLTTGVTIKEWTAVLMLTDIKTPSLYMQAAFRAQNPYKEFRNGELNVKKSAYLFDFAPTRVLEIYDQFANGLNPKAVTGEITEKDREENIQELLNFFPIISEDINGEMIELDAEKVLTFPNALAASEIVNARFMTNLLFNDSLKGVFNFPKEVEEILDKMPKEKNKRVQKTKNRLDLDDARKVNDNKTTKINENTELILGKKKFKANTERVVDNLLKQNNEQVSADVLVESIAKEAEPLIAKYKEVYKTTVAETNEARKQIQEKVKIVAEEYNNSDIKDSADLKQKIIDILEEDFVKNKVAEKEQEVVEKVQKTKEDEIRDRLRSFTRTIPMFIMANASKNKITIDNFDLEIDDKDFLDLTSITKEEFHKLRDGFDYEEDGERKTFQGVFNKYRFNASIAEFKSKKDQLANYFTAKDDIFELIPNQKTNQIFTPKKMVQMMVNKLEEQDPTLFTRTDSTFIDLYMKSGMYITEIVKKLFKNTRKHYKNEDECLKHILENQVFGLSPTSILQGITQSYIFGFDIEQNISRKNFIHYDLTPEAKEGTAKEKLQKLLNLNEDMKFDAVIGNPPYNGENGQQIYPFFYIQGKKIGNNVCLIFPIGWQKPKNANNLRVLNNEEIKTDHQIVYINNIKNAFPGVAGAEWTNILLWVYDYNNGLDGKQKILTNNDNPDIKKLIWRKEDIEKPEEINKLAIMVMDSCDFKPLQDITSPAKPYGLRTDFLKDPEKYNLPPVQDTRQSNTDIELWTGGRSGRLIKYLPSDYPLPKVTKALNKYKIFVTYAWGNMSEDTGFGGAFSDIIIAYPNVATTETWQESGLFENFEQAKKHAKYLMTRFTRSLLYVNKHSQHSTTAWGAVPIQDYTESWWHESIQQLENRLFDKYNIPADVRRFVLENIQKKTESNIVNFLK
jgi:superfamily II DNA or RNA helicase